MGTDDPMQNSASAIFLFSLATSACSPGAGRHSEPSASVSQAPNAYPRSSAHSDGITPRPEPTSNLPRSAHRATPPTLRVFRGDAPDDGAGYVLALGPTGVDGCSFAPDGRATKDGFRIGMARVAAPHVFRFAGDQFIEGWVCESGSCFSPRGTVTLDSITPGVGARGRLQLLDAAGAVRRDEPFVASWCGPRDSPPPRRAPTR